MITPSDLPSLTAIIREAANQTPDWGATWFEDRQTSFAEIDKLSNRIANGLIGDGVRPGDVVAICLKNSDQFLPMVFGIWKARACVLPLNWRLAAPELAFILRDSESRLVFCDAAFSSMITAETTASGILLREAGERLDDWLTSCREDDPFLATERADGVLQLYTSGTTGSPKGVRLNHHNLLTFYAGAIGSGWAEWRQGKTFLLTFPLFHVAGFNLHMLACLQGVRTVIVAQTVPAELLILLDSQRISYTSMVPAVLDMVLRAPGSEAADLSALEKISYGGSPISEDLLARALKRLNCKFNQLYGMTETSGGGTQLPPEAHDPAHLRSCGIPLPNYEVRIGDGKGGICPPGVMGEIQIRSEGVAAGYWRRPDLGPIAPDGWFPTGDAGYMDEDGFFYIRDRIKDMIVTGGENVYPAEVENALIGHDDIIEVAVIGVPDEKWGEAVKAFVVLREGAPADAPGIIQWARSKIGGFKLPKTIEFVETLPRNQTGKILRRTLRDEQLKRTETK